MNAGTSSPGDLTEAGGSLSGPRATDVITDANESGAGAPTGICYTVVAGGHRAHYADLLSRELGFKPLIARLDMKVFRELAGSKCTFFVTLDDDILGFILVAFARMLLGRPTVGLFLRPRECFEAGRLKGWIKWLVFRLLNGLPPIKMLTILPFWLEPRFEQVASGWIYDPQFWDLNPVADRTSLPMTPLAEDVLGKAAGRKIVVSFGQQTREKGFGRIADIWRSSKQLRDEYLFVVAGIIPAAKSDYAQGFAAAGGHLVPRFLTEGELLSLYRIADYAWCCYAPNYDQASGIFGRAMQLGVPALVRQGSFVQAFADHAGIAAVALPYYGDEVAVRILCDAARRGGQVARNVELLTTMRIESLARIRKALRLTPGAAAIDQPAGSIRR